MERNTYHRHPEVRGGFSPLSGLGCDCQDCRSKGLGSEFDDWLASQDAGVQSEYFQYRAANPSDPVISNNPYSSAGMVSNASQLSNLPTWAWAVGGVLLAMLVLPSVKR